MRRVARFGARPGPDGGHEGNPAKAGLFSKSIAWPQVAGTEVRSPYFRVLVRAGDKTKKGLEIPNVGWNVVLLPRVIKLLSERMA